MILPPDAVSIRYDDSIFVEISIDGKQTALYDTIGAFNILTDTAIISLSACMMWKVHVLVWKRFIVVATFGLRFL